MSRRSTLTGTTAMRFKITCMHVTLYTHTRECLIERRVLIHKADIFCHMRLTHNRFANCLNARTAVGGSRTSMYYLLVLNTAQSFVYIRKCHSWRFL